MSHTTHTDAVPAHRSRVQRRHRSGTVTRRIRHLPATLLITLLAVGAWLRGDQPIDDRGSDTSEKAFMVILAITLGTAVSAAAVAFVASKTALFK